MLFRSRRDALVLAKSQISSADVIQWTPEDFDRQFRRWYQDAYDARLILRLNMAIRALGTEAATGIFHWEYTRPDNKTITAKHNASDGTTTVTVGGVTVLDNTRPGAELFNPGEKDGWLYTLESVYQQKKAEAAWTEEMEAQKLLAAKVANFLASV